MWYLLFLTRVQINCYYAGHLLIVATMAVFQFCMDFMKLDIHV